MGRGTWSGGLRPRTEGLSGRTVDTFGPGGVTGDGWRGSGKGADTGLTEGTSRTVGPPEGGGFPPDSSRGAGLGAGWGTGSVSGPGLTGQKR